MTAWSEHEGDRFPAAVRAARAVGVQFHPEKSSAPGVALVAAWVRSLLRPAPNTVRHPMIAIPAVDLRDGACVQLVGGSYAEERVRLDDPLDVAREWAQLGFRRLHVVDLDAATGRGSNAAVVDESLADGGFDAVQVGGGVRDGRRGGGAARGGRGGVVVGTRAIEEPDWLAEAAARFPGEIIVAPPTCASGA